MRLPMAEVHRLGLKNEGKKDANTYPACVVYGALVCRSGFIGAKVDRLAPDVFCRDVSKTKTKLKVGVKE